MMEFTSRVMAGMSIEDFQAWGQRDGVGQQHAIEARDRELLRFWRCSCGRRLLRGGYIWARRWESFVLENRLRADSEIEAGYYCDGCTDRRERGLD